MATVNAWLEFQQDGDFEFTFDDGTSIFGHTGFLKLQWEYFKNMCESGMKEALDIKLHITDCKSDTFLHRLIQMTTKIYMT